jgi:hypothetical protein
LTPCLGSLLTRRDRDFRGGWLRLLMPPTVDTTTRGRRHVQTLDLGRVRTSGLLALDTRRLHSVGWHPKPQSATQLCHLEVPKSAAHPRLKSNSGIGTSKSLITQAIRAPGHTPTPTRSTAHGRLVSKPSHPGKSILAAPQTLNQRQ